jgi:S-(hydroxymethyl)glutathione dehydrogenase/alcohol dehydrogenase
MKAAILRQINTPMTIEEVDLLEPRAGEVKVKLTATGICHSCLHVIDGSLAGVALPMVLGDEGAGVVTGIGSGVTNVAVGDHVVISWSPACGYCRYCVSGRPVQCINQPPFGYLGDGSTRMKVGNEDILHFGPATYSTENVIPASCAIPINKNMPLDIAALIGCSVMTGVGAVIQTANVPVGATLAIYGCGGIGLNAIQGGVLAGASKIIAVDVSDQKLKTAEMLGATHLVRADKNPIEEILKITGGGVDYAVVCVGNLKALEQAWESMAPGGTCVSLALYPSGQTMGLDPNKFAAKELKLIGSRYCSARPSIDFATMVDLYMSGKLKLTELVSKRYDFDEINEAHRALAAGEVTRTMVIF